MVFVFPLVPVLINKSVGPEILFSNDVTILWFKLTFRATDNERQMVLGGALDGLGQFIEIKDQRARLAAFHIHVGGLS